MAIIFDLDGTVLDNENLWSQAFLQVLGSLGVHGLAQSPHQKGIGLKANWARLLNQFHIQTALSLADLDHATHKAYFEIIDQIKLRRGFEDFASSLKSRGVRLALATSSHRSVVNYAVNKFHLDRFFSVIVCADDVKHTKPDPEIFLLAAQRLGVSPKNCHVYEDAKAGLEAARAAGMTITHVTEDYVFKSQ